MMVVWMLDKGETQKTQVKCNYAGPALLVCPAWTNLDSRFRRG
jgi:hypothetical protein